MSDRDETERFLRHGVAFPHATVPDWEKRLSLRFAQELSAKRQGHVGKLGSVDETDGKGKDQWYDLYRVIDEAGN